MFKSKTVFVIGAGASCEAGLPSGKALRASIAELVDIRFSDGYSQTSGDTQIMHCLRVHANNKGADMNIYLQKAWRIRDALPTLAISIDNFLDAHGDDEVVELCGKLGIVKSILAAEGKSLLRSKGNGEHRYELNLLADTWYVDFFQLLTEGVSKTDVAKIFDNVKIITFNYDRCIERFLTQALAEYYDLPEDRCNEVVSTLKIYHPYGALGSLSPSSNSVPFGASQINLLSVASGIKTFSEGLDDEALLSRIRSTVAEAETVVFMGFAFHPMNMELITPPQERELRIQRVFATTYGMSKADENVIGIEIAKMFRKWRRIEASHSAIPEVYKAWKPEMANMNCKDFFLHYFRSLSAGIAN